MGATLSVDATLCVGTLFPMSAAVPRPPVAVPVGPRHAGASMAIRRAAMPRDPYAFTEPRDIPSVSAT